MRLTEASLDLSSQLSPHCRHSGQNPISPWYIPATVWWSRTGRAEYSPLWRPVAPLATAPHCHSIPPCQTWNINYLPGWSHSIVFSLNLTTATR